ncbi:hypothetical protein [Paraliomyxa miuraensis]|uniref:hypothetical protein n=1 Tax=Paraliomyxa miuraensis TaxID=376150 RepID=UPI002254E53E|nr:hypothetical protein [Paraliomyxa miuraensis]MCX4246142.1 hypothetical protein [Paraliomyxa miuraensis]
MRCRAYQIPSEVYREIETQILQQLRDGDLDQLRHLLSEHDLEVELLSGEWRILFAALEDYFQEVDHGRRIARMAVSPDELAEFVDFLRDEQRQEQWRPISFGLAELTDALPVDCDLVGVVFTEESDDWLWAEPVSELVAIRPEVFELIEPHMRTLMSVGDFAALARLAEDHAEGCVELSAHQWRLMMKHSAERVPELLPIYQQRISAPDDYTGILEGLGQVADPRFQPSLDAWLRVHSNTAQYALYFRDAGLERRELEGSGLIRLSDISIDDQVTQRLPVIPGGSKPAHVIGPPRLEPATIGEEAGEEAGDELGGDDHQPDGQPTDTDDEEEEEEEE